MIFDEFMLYWGGRGCDWDGRYGFQCVDLWRHYVNSVWDYPQSPGVIGAADIWDSYDQLRWTRIPNTPKGVPQKGDVIIWNRDYGPLGHVAIAVGIGDTRSFYSFDQNMPLATLPHIQLHNYNGLYGWLRAK